MSVAADTLVNVSVSVIPAATTSATLGVPCLITTDPLDGVNRYLSFTTATGIAAALTATYIGATTAAKLTTMLAQTPTPTTIACIRYDTGASEVPSDGLDAAIALGLDVGPVELSSTVEATINTLAAWFTASAARKARYMLVVQSADTGLYGGSKPAALVNCEQLGCRMFFSADADHTASAWMGILGGKNLAQGPIGARARPLTVAIATLTEAQKTAALANEVGYIDARDNGASASQRIFMGTKMYDGTTDVSDAVTIIYAARQLRAAMLDLWTAESIPARKFPADARGMALASAAAERILGAMHKAIEGSHFTITETYPQGYRIVPSISGSGDAAIVLLNVTLSLAREPVSINVPVVGVEV